MATSENWQLFVHNGRHNHKIDIYSHEQLQQTKQFRKSHVPPLPRKFTMLLQRLRGTGCREEIRYNMPLLECVGMTPTEKNFTVATAFMCNEQATTYRWILQQIKHLYFPSAMSNGQGSVINEGEPLGLDLSIVAFWGRDNKPGRVRTFCFEAVAINVSLRFGHRISEYRLSHPMSNCRN
ncbi:hypothetical protein M9H77_11227 [Catharanthus roseus]|uniref:Uncharacterized protein n=1 Tax=Catharanthus roseus TaxID=4058 RepID=A0ACC0BE15_CATRO|nr:hypothetical protein M9H77_11227 [Catharanthus roseus]